MFEMRHFSLDFLVGVGGLVMVDDVCLSLFCQSLYVKGRVAKK